MLVAFTYMVVGSYSNREARDSDGLPLREHGQNDDADNFELILCSQHQRGRVPLAMR